MVSGFGCLCDLFTLHGKGALNIFKEFSFFLVVYRPLNSVGNIVSLNVERQAQVWALGTPL